MPANEGRAEGIDLGKTLYPSFFEYSIVQYMILSAFSSCGFTDVHPPVSAMMEDDLQEVMPVGIGLLDLVVMIRKSRRLLRHLSLPSSVPSIRMLRIGNIFVRPLPKMYPVI